MNNNFLFYGTARWPIYKKKEKRAKYFFEIYIYLSRASFFEIDVYDTFPLQGSILNHGLSLSRSSFRKGYIRNSSLRIWNTAKGEGVPRFPHRKIETREHLRLIAPLPNQSSIFPVRIKSARFPVLYLNFSVRLTKVYRFLFFFFFFSCSR